LLTHKYLLLSQNNFVNIIFLQSQNLFCKTILTNKAFWLYLTKYFVSNPNPDPNNHGSNNRVTGYPVPNPGNKSTHYLRA